MDKYQSPARACCRYKLIPMDKLLNVKSSQQINVGMPLKFVLNYVRLPQYKFYFDNESYTYISPMSFM